jgi:hypothetical protein
METQLKRKQPCPFQCGSSDAYSETNSEKGAFGKCFSCGKFKWLSGEFAEREDELYIELPRDRLLAVRIYDIPAVTMRQYGVGYAEKYRVTHKYVRYSQLVLQCWLDGEYLGCQLKNLRKKVDDKFKYFTLKKEPLIYYTALKTAHCDTLVITEDWASSIKVKYAFRDNTTIQALAITGNNFNRRSHLFKFIQKIKPNKIIVWLDNDAAGIDGSKHVTKCLSNVYDVVTLYNVEEPKLQTVEKIKETINEQ